jgi:molecular chaperone DnaK
MRDEAKANEEADKREREKIDKINAADSTAFQTEKQLKEYGDKIPLDKRTAIEAALAKLKDAHTAQDVAAIDAAMKEINDAWQAASQDIYNATQAQGAAGGAGSTGNPGNPFDNFPGGDPFAGGANPNAGNSAQPGQDNEVKDVDFEEVK